MIVEIVLAYGFDHMQMIKTCSLVSSHWANLCRPVLLQQRLANITSLSILKLVRCMLEWKGSPHLYGLHHIVTRRSFEISVYPKGAGGPWLHHVTPAMKTLSIKSSTALLKLDGRGFNPRWKQADVLSCFYLPTTLPPDFFSIFTHIDIHDCEFPSLDKVIMLLARFRKVQRYDLQNITWTTERDLGYIQNNRGIISPGSSQRVVLASKCSSNAQLCIQMGFQFEDFPLDGISAEEMSAVGGLLENFHANLPSHKVRMEWGKPSPSFICCI
jgi:hypothetical protein